MNDKLTVVCLLDEAVLDELAHQVGSYLASLVVRLHPGQSVLHFLELGRLHLLENFKLCFGVFFFLDLGLRPPPLRRNLEHVGTDTLVNCRKVGNQLRK